MIQAILPSVPPDLAAKGATIRPETPEDRDFLRRLYASVRWEELEPAGWPDAMRHTFLAQQFDLQDHHYKTNYPGAAYGIICLGGEPVGRLYLHQGREDLRIIDIAILDGHRGLGIGTGMLRAVFDLGVQAGAIVSVHVEMFNKGARRLYDRLGFVAMDETGVHHRLHWQPPALRMAAPGA